MSVDSFEMIALSPEQQIDSAMSRTLDQNPAVAYLMSLGSKRSQRSMASLLNITANHFGYRTLEDCCWRDMRRHHIQALLQRLNDLGRAPATINTYLAAIKGVALEAWTLRQMDTDSYQHIRQIKGVKGYRVPKGRQLSAQEVIQLFKICDSDSSPSGVRDGAILSVLLGCGLRRSEVVDIDLDHLDFSQSRMTVMGKGNKQRVSFMPDATNERLSRWIEQVRGEYTGALFTRIRRHGDVTSERMTDQAIHYILETRRKAAGLSHFGPHDLRRTYASNLLANGVDIATVKDAMGHASIITTQKYDHRGDDRLRKASETLDFGV